MVNDNLVLLAGDYDARLASRNMELLDLETLESMEITVRDYHPGPRFFMSPVTILFVLFYRRLIRILVNLAKVASAASISICNNSK